MFKCLCFLSLKFFNYELTASFIVHQARDPSWMLRLYSIPSYIRLLVIVVFFFSFLFIFLKDFKLNKIIFIIYYVIFFKILSFSKLCLGETATWAPSSQETWGLFFDKIACFQMKFRETNIAMAMIPAQCKGDMFPLANWSNPESAHIIWYFLSNNMFTIHRRSNLVKNNSFKGSSWTESNTFL